MAKKDVEQENRQAIGLVASKDATESIGGLDLSIA
jgi:hypothetical protein